MTADASPSFGLINGRPVFMDEATDSYFCLDPAEEADFLAALIGRDSLRPACAIASTTSLVDDYVPLARPRVRDVLRAFSLVRRAKNDIASRPIAQILGTLHTGPIAPGQVEHRALRFLAARRLLPWSANCLTDAIALLRWLGPRDDLHLIFGAKLDPFEAHCWVQHGPLLISDRLDHIAPFKPVRVLSCTAVSH